MSITAAVVLAAGEGERLRPLTRNRPKPMLPAANRPIIEYVFDALVDAGIEELHVVVGYKRDRVQGHVGSTYRGVPVTYHTQEKQLGSAHAALQARDALDDDFLVVNGDQIAQGDLVADVMATHDAESAVTLAVIESDDASMYGAVETDGDRVTRIVERPGGDEYRLLNAGVYACDASLFSAVEDAIGDGESLTMPNAISSLVESGFEVRAARTSGLWTDATYPWDLLAVGQQLLDRGDIDGTEVREGVWCADRVRIHEDAVLRPPVVVSSDSEIGANAVVGPHVALGQNVTVGSNATVERSVLDADTRVGAGSTLVDCVTGQGVSLGPGCVAPGGPADVAVGTTVHEDRRLGALVADRATARGGVTFVPGTLVGPNAELDAGTTVSGVIAENGRVMR
ncbi:sugar phosphate nucleotidyltransferase [Haloarchaeobius sp. FL176]|uniref:sugar phosphate nucleotidyltransferase n=1 Tax=Haloarchaeobius sp. FL176 TaxID=2967129 RepID=UPI002147FA4B|nr:sugar phosphate nucleotidyltransferase [Haloarchaeobius sp. FL176]